jgi:molybdopterin-guanine dinucleotide biosynthesis protein A
MLLAAWASCFEVTYMPDNPLSVVILLGGASKRMGADKAWLVLDGQPMVERLARRVQPLAAEILFCAASSRPLQSLTASLAVPARIIADRYAGAGPLAGLHAGLSEAANDRLLLLAVDMPLVNLALLRHMAGLAEGYDAVMPWIRVAGTGDVRPTLNDAGLRGGHEKPGADRPDSDTVTDEPGVRTEREPLHAVYRRSCLAAVEAHLAAGDRRVVSFLPEVRVRDLWPDEIARFDPDFSSFFNTNTPGDWDLLRKMLSGRPS